MQTLNIRVNGAWLDLPDNARLKYRLTNNIFFDGEKQRERSLQFSAPYTPNNNAALGRLADHGTKNDAQKVWMNCEVFSGQSFVFEATLKVNSTRKGYAMHLLGAMGTLHEIIGDDNMRDIPWATGLTAPVTRQDIAEGDYDDYPVWYPAMLMFQAAPQAALADVNEGLFTSLKGRYISPSAFPNNNANAANAAFYLLYLLDTISAHYGIGLIGGIWRTSELKDLLMHSSDIRDFDWEKVNFTPESVPDMKVLDFIGVLEYLFCCEFRIDNDLQLSCTFLRDTAVRTDLLDLTDRISGAMERKWTDNTEGVKLQWPDALADMYKPVDLGSTNAPEKFDTNADTWAIQDVQDVDYEGLHGYVRRENHWMKFETYGNSLKWVNKDWNMQIQTPDPQSVITAVADYASLPTPSGTYEGKFCLVMNEGWYYGCTGSVWDKAFWNATSAEVGQRHRIIEPQGYPIPMDRLGPDYEGDEDGYEFIMRLPGFKNVSCRSDATDTATAQQPTDILPVFSFKREIVTVSETFWPGGVATVLTWPYCYASSDEYDADLNDTYDMSLWWDGPKGLYETWWKEWASVLAGSQEMEVDLNLTLTDLLTMDMHRPIMLLGIKCWIRELNLDLPLRGATKCRVMRVG